MAFIVSRGTPGPGTAASVLGVATLIQVVGAILSQSLAVLGPELTASLHLSAAGFGLLLSGVNLGTLLALLLGGVGGDLLAARSVLAVSAVGSGILVVIAALVDSVTLVEVLLAAAGFTWGASIPAGGGAVIRMAPASRRGLFVSIRQLGLPLGGVVAALLSPPVVARGGWRAMFLLEGALFVMAALVAVRTPLPRARVERRLRALTVRTLALGVGGALLGAAQWVFLGYLTLQLTRRFGVPFALAATVFLAAQACGALGRLVMGWASDRYGSRTVWLAATSLAGAGCLLSFGVLPPTTPLVPLILLSLGSGFAVMAWNGMLIAAFAEAGPRELASTSIGAGLLLNRLGAFAAPPLFGLALGGFSPGIAWTGTALVLVAAAITFAGLGLRSGVNHPTWDG
ncbi:MAG TPA: MFS transporter [Candidatus Dormibacteraeota bacterium]|jgi:MFS family permease|nr:MFS transporter [Candidatus Dormibacteraeota bacterium]